MATNPNAQEQWQQRRQCTVSRAVTIGLTSGHEGIKSNYCQIFCWFFFFSFSREARNPDFYVKSHYLEMLATN